MKERKILSNFALLAVIFIVGLFLINQPAKNLAPENIKYVKIWGQIIKVDLALTKDAQAQGLSGRNGLKEKEGMLFVFDNSDIHSFWMKDMNFPIDIIWLDEAKKVIYIKKDAQPVSLGLQRGEPDLYLETYGPRAASKYVLEVVSGFSDKNNLKEGDGVEFVYKK